MTFGQRSDQSEEVSHGDICRRSKYKRLEQGTALRPVWVTVSEGPRGRASPVSSKGYGQPRRILSRGNYLI